MLIVFKSKIKIKKTFLFQTGARELQSYEPGGRGQFSPHDKKFGQNQTYSDTDNELFGKLPNLEQSRSESKKTKIDVKTFFLVFLWGKPVVFCLFFNYKIRCKPKVFTSNLNDIWAPP